MRLLKRASSSIPSAISLQRPKGDEAWTEFDGRWSTFNLQVGNNSGGQNFRFVPSTSSLQSWVTSADTCAQNVLDTFATTLGRSPGTPSTPADCARLRGTGLYQAEQSNGYVFSYSDSAQNLSLNTNQNYAIEFGDGDNPVQRYGSVYNFNNKLYADYLFFSDGSGGEITSNTPVPVFADSSLYVYTPEIGLGFGETDIGTDTVPSLLQALGDAAVIPSRSWGYTAGASYKPDYPGSLVLGGIDEARIQEGSTATFDMTDKDLLVRVSSISLDFGNSTSNSGPNGQQDANHGAGFDAIIDSTLPYIYLPPDVCRDFFAANFNLQYGNSDINLVGAYTLSRDQAVLNERTTRSITFAIGDQANSTARTTISLPYSAFNMDASWTWGPLNTTTAPPLFPIMPIPSGTSTNGKAILGRVFLQEAYVSANYENSTFSVSRAAFPASTEPKVVDVYSAQMQQLLNEQQSDHGLSSGAIAGIAVGAVLGVGLVAGLLLWFLWLKPRRKRAKEEAEEEERKKKDMELDSLPPKENVGRDRTWSTTATEVDAVSPSIVSSSPGPTHRPSLSTGRRISEMSDPESEHTAGIRQWQMGTVAEVGEGSDDKTDTSHLQHYSVAPKYAGGSGQTSPEPTPGLTPPLARPQEMEGSVDWLYPNQRRPLAQSAAQSSIPAQSPVRGPSPMSEGSPMATQSPDAELRPEPLRTGSGERRG